MELINFTLGKLKPDLANRKAIVESFEEGIRKYFKSPGYFENNVIFVDGGWGSGKSWIINNTLQSIIENNEDKLEVNAILYKAWEYLDSSNLYYDLITLVEKNSLVSEGVEVIGKVNKVREIANITGEISSGALNILENTLIDSSLNLVPFYPQIKQILKALTYLKSGEDLLSILNKINESISKQSSEEIITSRTSTNAISELKFKPTIIIIDDLDRAKEESVWKILTLLNLFRDEKLLFILVGSKDYIKNILDQKYHLDPASENFINKYIGIDFKLPEIEKDLIINNFISMINIENYKKINPFKAELSR